MQAGFALVETGFCRAKHAAHVVSTNFAIFGLGFVAFFLVGFPIMFSGFSYAAASGIDGAAVHRSLIHFGDSGNWVFLWGRSGFGLSGVAYSVPVAAFFLYMVAFMDTTATIPTGAMAERWKWKAFVGWGLFCGALYYPIFGGVDVGRRLAGQAREQPGTSASATSTSPVPVWSTRWVGSPASPVRWCSEPGSASSDPTASRARWRRTTSRWRCWERSSCCSAGSGSTPRSTFAATDLRFTVVAVNTAIAAAFGATIAMFYCMKRMGKPDPGMMANGMLAGLVAITAPCAFVQPWAAAVIGAHRRGPRGRVGVLLRAQGHRRPGRRDLGARCLRHLGCALRRDLRRRSLRRRLERDRCRDTAKNAKGVTGILYGSGKLFGSGSFGKLGFGQLASQAIGASGDHLRHGWHRLRVLQDPERDHEGRHPLRAGRREAGLDLPEMGVLAYDNLQVRELDIVGIEGDIVMTGGPSQEPTTGR